MKREPVVLRDFVVAFARTLGLPSSYRFYVYNEKNGCAENLLLPLVLKVGKLKRIAAEDTVAAATRSFKAVCSSTPGSGDWTVYLEGLDFDGRPGTINGSCTVAALHLRFSLAQLIGEHGLDALKGAVAALRFVPAKIKEESCESPLAPWVEEDADN